MTERTDTTAGAAADAISTALAETRVQPGTLASFVASQTSEIAKALPGGLVDAERYVRIVQTELRKNPDLMKCTPQSFLGAVMTAAQLGLEFGPTKQAYLVPFGGEVTLMIGYPGWLKLIDNTGGIQDVSARTVYADDTFLMEYGLDERLVHVPAKDSKGQPKPATERGEVTGYYCVIRKTNGGRTFSYMSKSEVVAHMNKYAKRRGKIVGPWADPLEFETMAWKTVFLKAKTWVPTSVEALASEVDNHVVSRMAFEQEPEVKVPTDDESDVVEGVIVNSDTMVTCNAEGHLGFHKVTGECIDWVAEEEQPDSA